MHVLKGISHPVFYGDQVYKLRSVKCEANFVSSGSEIVKRLRRRKYSPVIIERTICLVLGTSTALYRSLLNIALWLTRRWGLYAGTCPNLLRGDKAPDPRLSLIVSRDSFSPWLASRRAEHSLLWRMSLYIFDILSYHFTYLRYNFHGLSALVGCWSSAIIRRIIYKFLNVYPIDYTTFVVSGKVWIL